ncbi:MAG: hypothetical protein KatS3mg008_1462 [Acidimicrobiales bacterium]|nr:MAG: hypothetical protein KatS3mg008_1462 [Acidimicrobiales bacterium]
MTREELAAEVGQDTVAAGGSPVGDTAPDHGDARVVQGDGESGAESHDAEPSAKVDRVEAGGESEADPATIAAQRDEYLEALQRLKAEFENFRKRTERQWREMMDRAAEHLVADLLPVLDACDAAIGHGVAEVEPIRAALLDVLSKAGLERMEPAGEVFDPEMHEAVQHEESDDHEGPPEVVEVMRHGYRWRGRVLRPALVVVRG